jgi:hypothetical protein
MQGNKACHDILRAYNFENLDGFEFEVDETVPESEIKEGVELPKVRTRKISSFAIKRVIYPETRILKHITYTVGEAVLNQFKYNKWTENNGYVNEAPNKDYRGLYVTKEKLADWKIDLSHMILEKSVLPTDDNYQMFLDDWHGSIDDLSQSCANESNPLAAISDCMNNIYNENFREVGVDVFYANKRRVFKEIAAEMRHNVEHEIYKMWRNGELSAIDLKRIVEVVAQYVADDLREEIQRQIVSNDDEFKASGDELSALRNDWAGVAINIFGQRKRIFAKYCDELAYYMEAKTKTIALAFASDLQQVVNIEFGKLVEDVTSFVTLLTDATDSVRTLIVAQRRTNPGLEDVSGAIIEVCEDKAMDNFERDFKLDQVAMSHTSQQLREAIIGGIEFINFADLVKRISVADIQEKFDTTLVTAVRARHDELPKAAPKVLGLNVLSQLQQQLDTDEAMDEFAGNLLTQADPFIVINNTEIDSQIRNNAVSVKGTNINLRECLIAIPSPDGNEGLVKFADKLEKSFHGCAKNGEKSPEIFKNSPKTNELYIVTINSGYPLRAVSWLAEDKRKYERFLHTGNLAQDRVNAIMLFGSGNGNNLPDLFALSNDKLAELDKQRAAEAAKAQAPAMPAMPGAPAMPPMPAQAQAPQLQLFVAINGAQYGPYDYATCQTLVANGQLTAQTLVWEQGMAAWTPAGQVAKLQSLFAPAMPPTMPPTVPPVTPPAMPQM